MEHANGISQFKRNGNTESHVLVQPIQDQLEILSERVGTLGDRMELIEAALDRILGVFGLPKIKEGIAQSGTQHPMAEFRAKHADPSAESDAGSEMGLYGMFEDGEEPEKDNSLQTQALLLRRDGPYAYTSLDSSKSQIRILAVQRSENVMDPIVADLKVISLEDEIISHFFHGYMALSYCWGPPEFDGSIILEGHHFPVTKSLDSALRNLRSNSTGYGPPVPEAYWWIDQICINQQDIDERGSQVSLMRRIYKRASAVHVWLGDEADDSSAAIDILNKLGAPPQHAPGEKAIQYPRLPEAEVTKSWKALDALFKRRWFERVWIRQEIALSFNIKMWCGSRSFEMSILGPALFMLNYVRSLGYEGLVPDESEDKGAARMPWDYHPTKLVELKNSTNGGFTWVELSRLLYNARGCKATDPRDSVFSILGLADPDVYPIIPDYHRDLREVLLAAAENAIPHEYGLDIFATCQNPERRHGLPSWVPNLVDEWKEMPFGMLDARGGRISVLHVSDEPQPDAHIEGEVLVLRGGLLDAVQFICKDAVVVGASADELEAVYASWQQFVSRALDRDIVKQKRAFLEERKRERLEQRAIWGDANDVESEGPELDAADVFEAKLFEPDPEPEEPHKVDLIHTAAEEVPWWHSGYGQWVTRSELATLDEEAEAEQARFEVAGLNDVEEEYWSDSTLWGYIKDSDEEKLRLWVRFLSVLNDEAEDLEGYAVNEYSYKKKSPRKKDAKDTMSLALLEPDSHSNPYHHTSWNYRLARSYLLPPDHSVKHLHPNRRIHVALERNGVGRRLCITKRGYIALIPSEAEIGDPIAVFHGATFPYVLRRVAGGNDHVLVGESWIPEYASARGERDAREEWEVDMDALIRLC